LQPARAKGAKRKRAAQAKPTPGGGKMTDKRWTDYLAGIANGLSHRDASHAVGLTMVTVDAYLISNVAAAGQLRDAKVLWNRREWPIEQIEEVLVQISIGKTIRQAFDAVGIERKRVASLYRLLLQDKALRKWYDEAREMQAESYADEIIDIADMTHNDRDEDGKIDHEVINRDRLRVDTRKWLSGKWNVRRFGDTKHHLHEGELNINHAAVLSGGRKRIEQLHARRKGQTVEGESEVVENNG
jgi:hypothetical protein